MATPLCTAMSKFSDAIPWIRWLVNEKGADVNFLDYMQGMSPIYYASSLDVLNVMLECGADPIKLNEDGSTPLTQHLIGGTSNEVMARLLQDPRVQANVDAYDNEGNTALHHACECGLDDPRLIALIQLLLQAGADLTLENADGETSLEKLEEERPTTSALLEQIADAQKGFYIIKVRRFVMAATRSNNATLPSFARRRVARGRPLPGVALAPVTDSENGGDEQGGRQFRTAMAFLVGMEGGGMPRDEFRVVLDLVMPFWDPSRRKGQDKGEEGSAGRIRSSSSSSSIMSIAVANVVVVGAAE